jgi:TatD DNase family protein
MFLETHCEGDVKALRDAVETWHPVAIGEIGLDYYLPDLDRDRQKFLFEQQLQIAQVFDLPVLLHVRKAHDEVLSCLRRHAICGGIVHAFSGSLPQAMKYIEMGFCLGIGGAITHERALRLRKTISQLPLSALVLETDAPDMAPAGHQGERNSPLNISLVLSVLSEVVGLDADTLSDITSANLERVLKCTFKGIAVS